MIEHFYKDLHGWFDFEDVYSEMTQKFDNCIFVEVGSWQGKSAAFLATEILNNGKNIKLHCVDTWEGSAEHQEGQWCHCEIVLQKGALYEAFCKNLLPVKEVIVPIKMTSIEASKLYEDNSLPFVYIDASHEYADVKNDIIHWLPKVKSGGTLAGHDLGFPGVNAAIYEMFGKRQINWQARGSSWVHCKN